MPRKRLALVTGGNRGLGLETCRQLARLGYEVILASRDRQKGEQKVESLCQEGLDVSWAQLDVADPKQIEQLYHYVTDKWGYLDVLINNAGVLEDQDNEERKLTGDAYFEQRRQHLEETLKINVVGPFELCDRFATLMAKNHYGRIVNVSSGAGQLSQPHAYYITYSISKAALNAVTSFLAAKWKGSNVLINSVCPGWVKTDMGGPQAPRTIEEGIRGILWAAKLPEGGPSGGFFRDGKPIEW